jgi:MerR family redox-sensitive transcriptional activator SoxR
LAKLPQRRTPEAQVWKAIRRAIRTRIEEAIADLACTRERPGGCGGCGCLSLENCAIRNPQDRLGREGPGPRTLLW